MSKRIIDYTEATEVTDSDYILMDSMTESTRKIKATALEGGGVVSISQSDYDALSTDEKNNGKAYIIGGSKIMYLSDAYNKQ